MERENNWIVKIIKQKKYSDQVIPWSVEQKGNTVISQFCFANNLVDECIYTIFFVERVKFVLELYSVSGENELDIYNKW